MSGLKYHYVVCQLESASNVFVVWSCVWSHHLSLPSISYGTWPVFHGLLYVCLYSYLLSILIYTRISYSERRSHLCESFLYSIQNKSKPTCYPRRLLSHINALACMSPLCLTEDTAAKWKRRGLSFVGSAGRAAACPRVCEEPVIHVGDFS